MTHAHADWVGMDYHVARQHIKNGDILLVRGTRIYSRVIQFCTRSVYSHVGIAHWIKTDGTTRLAVCEAMEGQGVRLFPLSEYLARGVDVDWYPITDDSINRDKVVAWAMQRWGKDYASPLQFLRSFGLVTKRIADWLRIPTRVDRDRYFCSWFSAEALKHGGWQPESIDDKPPCLMTPGDIALFTCLGRGGRLVLGGKA